MSKVPGLPVLANSEQHATGNRHQAPDEPKVGPDLTSLVRSFTQPPNFEVGSPA